MIKNLIEDITFDKITLSQALTRAKIIAYKIDNSQFKEWLSSEINGYTDNHNLPQYRIISCDVFAEVFNPFRGQYTIPFDVSNLENDLKTEVSFYKMYARQSIPTLEEGIKRDEGQDFGYEYLPVGLVQILKSMVVDGGSSITAVKRRIYLSEIKHIISTTKQKLLDTLLELNDVFPNLEDEYKNDTQNSEKAQTIITQNIYGDNTNSNIGIGENINQTIRNDPKIEKFISEIRDMGFEEKDITEIKKILSEKNKINIGKKIMTWIGKMSNKAIEKGIELRVPVLIEKLSDFM